MKTRNRIFHKARSILDLKVVALGPVHGYAIAQRLGQVSRGVVQVPQGSLIRRCTGSKTVAYWWPTGR